MSDALLTWCVAAIASTGDALTRSEPLRVEASHRRFHRLITSRTSYVCMHSPPELENNTEFVRLARIFGAHGLRVPQIIASAPEDGYFLLEDLGPVHFADLYGTALEPPAVASAIAALHVLQSIDEPTIAAYDVARFAAELDLFNEWFLGALLGGDPARSAYAAPYAQLIAQTQAQPQVCVHRDYHCRNLLFNDGVLGIVDFQDALCGPALYDLASLLYDCYYEFDEASIARWLQVYVFGSPLDLTLVEARRWLDLTAIQRHLKAVGIFARLHIRDAKSSHLRHIEPVLLRTRTLAARHPETRPLLALLDAQLPIVRATLADLS